MRSHRRKQHATLWFQPGGGRITWEWLDVTYVTPADVAEQVEAAVRRDLPGLDVHVDVALLDGGPSSRGLVIYQREDIAQFGFYRHHRPEQPPAGTTPPAAAPDEPGAEALFAPPPPPPTKPTTGVLT